MGKGWQVKCSQGYCKFKGSYSSLVGAKEAIADHKAETQKRSLGAHQAVIVQETPRGTRSATGGRRAPRNEALNAIMQRLPAPLSRPPPAVQRSLETRPRSANV